MTTEPTGREHLTPVEITSTSATERAGFRGCKRRWFLTTAHRLDPQEGSVFSFLGDIYHRGLQGYYLGIQGGKTHLEASEQALDWYQAAYDEKIEDARKRLGFIWAANEPLYREFGEMGMEMIQNYLDREEHDPLFDEVVAVEVRVEVDIKHPKTGRVVGKLSVQTDVVGRRNGVLAIGEHKTRARAVAVAHLDIDDQVTAEAFAVWIAYGEFPEEAAYNVSFRKVAGPPRQIKGSKAKPVKLSKDRNQGTTLGLYEAEIERLGLDRADYEDILEHLRAREESGESALFQREWTFRSKAQLESFQRNLFYEFRDMQEVARNPESAYPNPTPDNCKYCSVRAICTTIEDDGDVEAIIKAGYVIAPPRR